MPRGAAKIKIQKIKRASQCFQCILELCKHHDHLRLECFHHPRKKHPLGSPSASHPSLDKRLCILGSADSPPVDVRVSGPDACGLARPAPVPRLRFSRFVRVTACTSVSSLFTADVPLQGRACSSAEGHLGRPLWTTRSRGPFCPAAPSLPPVSPSSPSPCLKTSSSVYLLFSSSPVRPGHLSPHCWGPSAQ